MEKTSTGELLKSGVLRAPYALMVRLKKKLRKSSGDATLPSHFALLSVSALLAQASHLADNPRYYFALAIAYLQEQTAENLRKALVCLRCAEALQFECPDRTTLYQGFIEARLGFTPLAQQRVRGLIPYTLTVEEQQIRENILRVNVDIAELAMEAGALSDSPWMQLYANQSSLSSLIGKTILVLGDTEARSAWWQPTQNYFSASKEVTGLSVYDLVLVPLPYDVVVATRGQQQEAQAAGVVCSHWLLLD